MTCPTPDKFAYPSERAAKDGIRGLKQARREGQGFMHAYRCGSHWHVGHGHRPKPGKSGRKFRW